MTPPIPRKFLKVEVICHDNQTKQETTSFNPAVLSTADLEKISKTLEGFKMEIFLELARRCGINRRPVGFYEPPKVEIGTKSRTRKQREIILDEAELNELMREL